MISGAFPVGGQKRDSGAGKHGCVAIASDGVDRRARYDQQRQDDSGHQRQGRQREAEAAVSP